MSKELLVPRQVEPSEVDLALTKKLQMIAQEAWTNGLNGVRTDSEVSQAFDPYDIDKNVAALKDYKHFSRKGRLIVVSTNKSEEPLGFAMAISDVSPYGMNPMSVAKRTIKRTEAVLNHRLGTSFSERVYAWEKHYAAKPDAPKGVGTTAVKYSLSKFHPDQFSAAYIDDENEQSLEFAGGLGYRWDGGPAKEVYRFGESNDPTQQHRHIAPVRVILENAEAILEEMGAAL